MKKTKKMIAAILAASMLLGSVPVHAANGVSLMTKGTQAADVSMAAQGVVTSPSEEVKLYLWLDDAGTPYYKVESDGNTLIEASKLGLNTSLGDLKDGFVVNDITETSSDTTWEPVVGEQAQIRDHYNQADVSLTHVATGLEVGISVRAYDEGVAFQYILPSAPEGTQSYTISDEYTQFVFPAGAKASLHIGGNQTVPKQYSVESLPSGTIQRPATIEYTTGQALTICEGNLDNYSVMVLAKSETARALEGNYFSSVTVEAANGPKVSPWRVFVIGDKPTDLLENDTIIQNLNEPADEETYGFSEWIDPGTCVRATTGLNNTAIKGVIDLAAEHGIRYVLLDSGWYGPEYDSNADPRLDPSVLDPENEKDQILLEKYFATEGGYNNTGEGVFNTRGVGFNQYGSLGDGGSVQVNVDIPALCEYGNAKGVGILLYVNRVFFPDSSGRNRFTPDELFAYYEKWGVAGVKPGFVNVRTQKYEQYMEEVIKAAAKHKLVMTVHDEYVPTGLERTYPNLMMTEGILGDEGIGRSTPQVAEDIATIFTRNVQGPPDHTYCYPGKATKAYALASPIMFRSGMSVIYWYTNPGMVPAQDVGKMDIWDDMPTNWEESLFLEGSLYEYATTARRTDEDVWYVGSLSAITRTLKLPLTFLDEGVTYVADIYADGVDADPYAGWTTSATAAKSKQTLENNKYLVTSDTVLQRDLKYGYGYAVVLKKATQEDLAAYETYSAARQALTQEVLYAEEITQSGYTTESWAVFVQALTNAQALLGDDTATEEAMEAAADALVKAKSELVSTNALTEAIQKASYYTSYHFTKESWMELETALESAKDLIDGGIFTQAQLDEAEKAIETAVSNLKEHENKILKETVYLSELNHLSKSSAYSNNIVKNKNRAGGALTLMVDGVSTIFERGMGFHAQADVYYNIEGMGFETFQSYVGVDAAKPTQGDIIFRVYGDGELLYESKPSGTGSQNAQFFSIPIAGVKELYLESNINGTNNGDWADWADAKFLSYQDPDAYLEAITVDGKAIPNFKGDTYEYYYLANEDGSIPNVDVIAAADDFTYEIIPAAKTGEYTEIKVTTREGALLTYKVYFLEAQPTEYLSDLGSLIQKNTLHTGNVQKDKDYKGGSIVLTAQDGTSQMPFEKGVGVHASSSTDSMVVYNIEGKDFARFEGYAGIRYATHEEEKNSGYTNPRSKINFKIYVDNETTPRFESGPMTTRTPAIYFNVDVYGAKTLTLVADACGDQSADHGCFGYARFSEYILPAADYAAVDEAVAAAEALVAEWYQNFDGVTAAINAVDRTKNYKEQDAVDAMAEAIYAAIEALKYEFQILTQPEDTVAEKGADAVVTVKALGEGLTYQWYYKNPGNKKFYASGNQFVSEDGAAYTIPMFMWRDGQEVYCVVTDANGESLQSNTVTLHMYKGSIQIIKQPMDVVVDAVGDEAVVTVEATGDRLTYQWYYKNPGNKKFYESGEQFVSEDGASYKIPVAKWRDGEQVYCVITDAQGVSVQTNTITLSVQK